MSDYKNWLEQHMDGCDICQEILQDPSLGRWPMQEKLDWHLEQVRDEADAQFQAMEGEFSENT